MFDVPQIVSILCGAVLMGALLSLASLHIMGILQQEGYASLNLLKWNFHRGNMHHRRMALLSLILALMAALFNVCFSFLGYEYANLMSAIPVLGAFAVYFVADKRYALKVPLKYTTRAVRLIVAHTVVSIALVAGFAFGLAALAEVAAVSWLKLLRFIPIAILPLFTPLTLALANTVMKAYEIPHLNGYIRRATRALDASACVKVGITGSFGKTSVKRIAAHILGSKYKVLATPASYNTPVGIAKCVGETPPDCDIFLAEMGARRVGEIEELCNMVKPTVGVVTGVCAQHVETFGSLENIRSEKGVLARRAQRVILGETAADMREDAAHEGVDFAAEDVELTENGVSFTLRVGEKRAHVQTELLGRHAAQDIALAAALCTELNMPFEEIVAAIPSVKPVPHRLEKSVSGGVVILDDAYNSNALGAKDAVEALKCFGGRKFVVTPGLVELGEIEEETNAGVGASFVGLDRIILVGESRVLALRTGYLGAGGNAEKVTVVPTLHRAEELLAAELQEGDAVLFLNDLPDKYVP